MLTRGELKADTLFSLWTPLKQTILRLNDKETIRTVGNIYSKYDFLREFIKGDNIEKLLSANESAVQHLSVLFRLGMGRGNVFILPDRQLSSARAKKPYYDYVLVFLLEAFPGGAFADYWDSPEDYLHGFTESWKVFPGMTSFFRHFRRCRRKRSMKYTESILCWRGRARPTRTEKKCNEALQQLSRFSEELEAARVDVLKCNLLKTE